MPSDLWFWKIWAWVLYFGTLDLLMALRHMSTSLLLEKWKPASTAWCFEMENFLRNMETGFLGSIVSDVNLLLYSYFIWVVRDMHMSWSVSSALSPLPLIFGLDMTFFQYPWTYYELIKMNSEQFSDSIFCGNLLILW